MGVLVVIPARFASVRYLRKPLVDLRGATGEAKSLIHRSWDAAMAVTGVDRVVIARDDDRIKDAAEAFGADVINLVVGYLYDLPRGCDVAFVVSSGSVRS
jgi:3-deoxy-manno-octulosonate cytidylyltransferase (CMP-KDO synthetase)